MCNFQANGPRTINFGMAVQVDEVSSVLEFELITDVLLNFKVKLLEIVAVGRCRTKYFGLLVVSNQSRGLS